MSYSITQAKEQRQIDTAAARINGDSKRLMQLAGFEKEEGNDELAEALYNEAKQYEREDDQIDYKQERETEQYESYRDNLNDHA